MKKVVAIIVAVLLTGFVGSAFAAGSGQNQSCEGVLNALEHVPPDSPAEIEKHPFFPFFPSSSAS